MRATHEYIGPVLTYLCISSIQVIVNKHHDLKPNFHLDYVMPRLLSYFLPPPPTLYGQSLPEAAIAREGEE